MSDHWVLIDTSYMCYRHFFQMRKLSHDGIATGVLFGFMRDLVALKEQFGDQFVFCFDYGYNKRKDIDSGYKSSRAKKREESTEEETKAFDEMRKQIDLLRTTFLYKLGFRNIVSQEGYEADDLIAKIAKQTKEPHRATIVSSDHDLYQCLRDNVDMWDPTQKKLTRKLDFVKEYHLQPTAWRMVKAIAGCGSDDVVGVKGVGEKTAVKYMLHDLKSTTKAYMAIQSSKKIIRGNMELVSLPMAGTKRVQLAPNVITEKRWDKMMSKFGMTSLRNKPPKLKRKGFVNGESKQGQFI